MAVHSCEAPRLSETVPHRGVGVVTSIAAELARWATDLEPTEADLEVAQRRPDSDADRPAARRKPDPPRRHHDHEPRDRHGHSAAQPQPLHGQRPVGQERPASGQDRHCDRPARLGRSQWRSWPLAGRSGPGDLPTLHLTHPARRRITAYLLYPAGLRRLTGATSAGGTGREPLAEPILSKERSMRPLEGLTVVSL